MKSNIILIICIIFSVNFVFAQKMNIHTKSGTDVYNLSDIDSITFDISNVIPTDSLIAYYPFNGNANDESGNENNGIEMGNVSLTTDRFDRENNAYYFDGIDSYLWFGDKETFKPKKFSITCWIKTSSKKTGYDNQMEIIRYRSFGYGIIVNPYISNKSYIGGIGAFIHISNSKHYTLLDTVNTYNNNTWIFIAITFDGESFRIYRNGNLVKQINSIGNKDIYYVSGGLAIGRDGNDSSDYFQGNIDDVRIYSRALTSYEINLLYNSNGL